MPLFDLEQVTKQGRYLQSSSYMKIVNGFFNHWCGELEAMLHEMNIENSTIKGSANKEHRLLVRGTKKG